MERFFGVLIEHYSGAFPMWLAPEQVSILTIADRHIEFAEEVERLLVKLGLRVTTSFSSDKLGAKIREARLMRIPCMAVIGDKEVSERGVSLRTRADGDKGFVSLDDLLVWIAKEASTPSV